MYRRLQKQNIPFAAGILYTNDIDYSLARLLAAETVTEEPFKYISDEAYERAIDIMNRCDRVINAGVKTEALNERVEQLLEYARISGKLHKEDDYGI